MSDKDKTYDCCDKTNDDDQAKEGASFSDWDFAPESQAGGKLHLTTT